nr:hypothetical protein [Tanacetum cinerariifolium]GFA13735.1 hypothetical protein [Tanacetum cinerariifolium]
MIHYLVKKVKKLERKKKSRTLGLKRLWKVGSTIRVESFEDIESFGDQENVSKQGRMINNINQDVHITLVNETQEMMNEEEMFGVNDLDGDEVIVDATSGEEVEQSIKVAKKEPSEVRTTSSSQPSQLSQAKDKGKGIMVKPKKPLKKKDQIAFDEEVARKLKAHIKAKMEEEERIAGKKDEANIAKRKKFFARKREIEKRNRQPTKAQQISVMCTFFKNIDGKKLKNLKKKLFDEIQKLFDSVMKRVNTFVGMNTEIVEERLKKTQPKVTKGSSKIEGEELESDKSKKQKLDKQVEPEVDNDQREAEMKMYMNIILNDEIEIDTIPLATKPPTLVDWKIIKKERSHIDREDLETLWKLVKAKYGNTRPKEGYKIVLWGDLKVMFKPDIEKKRYPLTPSTITEMMNRKLQADH